jgi:hypothetical protein
MRSVTPWLRPSVYRNVRMLETVPVVWGTSYGRWESTSDILYLHNSQFYKYNGKDARNVTDCIRLTVQTKDRQFNTTLCRESTEPLNI